MIAGVIRWSARNSFLVLLATAFIVFAGVYAVRHTALDAIPDLSDTQVIVNTEYPGQAPQVIEDQVTYPLTTSPCPLSSAMPRRSSGPSSTRATSRNSTGVPICSRSPVLRR